MVTCRICSATTSEACQVQDCPIRPSDSDPGTADYARLHGDDEYDPTLDGSGGRSAGAGLGEKFDWED